MPRPIVMAPYTPAPPSASKYRYDLSKAGAGSSVGSGIASQRLKRAATRRRLKSSRVGSKASFFSTRTPLPETSAEEEGVVESSPEQVAAARAKAAEKASRALANAEAEAAANKLKAESRAAKDKEEAESAAAKAKADAEAEAAKEARRTSADASAIKAKIDDALAEVKEETEALEAKASEELAATKAAEEAAAAKAAGEALAKAAEEEAAKVAEEEAAAKAAEAAAAKVAEEAAAAKAAEEAAAKVAEEAAAAKAAEEAAAKAIEEAAAAKAAEEATVAAAVPEETSAWTSSSVDSLLAEGKVQEAITAGWMGNQAEYDLLTGDAPGVLTIDVAIARSDGALGLYMSEDTGAPFIDEIIPGGAAEKCGQLMTMDVVSSVEGRSVFTLDATLLALSTLGSKTEIRLRIRRAPQGNAVTESRMSSIASMMESRMSMGEARRSIAA